MDYRMLSFLRPMLLAAGVLASASAALAQNQVVDFEDLSLEPGNYWNGSDGSDGSDGFTSRGVTFANTFTDWGNGWTSWSGWSYSNTTDTETPGLGNQFSAYVLPDGGGVSDSANYAVYSEPFGGVSPTITFGSPVTLLSAWFANTTYAYRAVVDGDDGGGNFVKGSFGADDWFKATVWGFDAEGEKTTSLDVYLADYRDADPDNWYALDTWTEFDLSSLDTVYSLGFELSSTDNGVFGMNTPAYFAMDNLTVVPEPSAMILLLCSAVVGMLGFGRRGRRRRGAP